MPHEFADCERIVAHPYAAPADAADAMDVGASGGRPVIAIGPEGGWTDDEVALLERSGFRRHSLGSRILRTDTATIAVIAQLMVGRDGDGR